ncbi:polyprenyl synthetase family protein [Clostridium polynesiense]|uniref:polyprenyl synthetase family protein n=1 Tax=Clostridium polynesiense TaxID=1325933 RepID=UPI00058D729E|nr:polyprenyl synthetase family protein [Clostridium polynesiense]
MDKMWLQYPKLKKEMEAVLQLMKESTRCKDKKIESSILDLINSGGKMLRPAFTLISSHFGEYNEERARALAAVMEMLHMATLVHDDVIDDSKLRRGQETIQSKYGKDYAVYIGDFLFCVCFKILASNSSLQSIKIDSKSMSRICLGEVEQLNTRFKSQVSIKDYLSRISGKTAELFSLSLYIGSAEAGASQKVNRLLWNIGHNIGMAFQIIDDVLDYTGLNSEIGKPATSDIKQGIFTLPIIYALQQDKGELRRVIDKSKYEDSDISMIISMVNNYGGIDKSKRLAEKYTLKAFNLIDKLPENEYKYILKDVAEMMLNRAY